MLSGSLVATALSSSAPTAVILAGSAVIVAAVEMTYHAIEEAKNAAYIKEAADVQAMHREYLANIVVPGMSAKTISLPAVFELVPPEKPTSVNSLHLIPAVIKEMALTNPVDDNTVLFAYREHLRNAIKKIKDYYFLRFEDDSDKEKLAHEKDVTSGVLSYLLQMLNNHFLKFEGYAYDIAYLNSLDLFINAYASSHGENSRHFSRLQPIFGLLKLAKKVLEDHKDYLSLTDALSELAVGCQTNAYALTGFITQAVMPEKYWNLINTLAMSDLAQGVIRPQYIGSEVHGFVLKHDGEIDLPDSVIKNWIKWLADYYNQAQGVFNRKKIIAPEEIFQLPDLNKMRTLLKSKDKKERAQGLLIQADLNKLKAIFKDSANFVTQKQVAGRKPNDSPVFVAVTGDEEVIEHAQFLVKLAVETHELISLGIMSKELLDAVKQLGQISLRNPLHYEQIFADFHALHQKVIANSIAVKAAMNESTVMQMINKTHFFAAVENALNDIEIRFKTYDKIILDWRDDAVQNTNLMKNERTTTNHELFELAHQMAEAHHIPQIPKLDVAHVQPAAVPPPPPVVVTVPHPDPVLSVTRLLDVNIDAVEAKIDATQPTSVSAPVATTPEPVVVHVTPLPAIPAPVVKTHDSVPSILGEVFQTIAELRAAPDAVPATLDLYEKAYAALISMLAYFTELQTQGDVMQKAKARQALALTQHFSEDLLEFLQGDRSKANAEKMLTDIDGQAKKPAGDFIDTHHRTFNKIFGGTTKTRDKVAGFEKIIGEIVKVAPVVELQNMVGAVA